jgi:hypothetical protein
MMGLAQNGWTVSHKLPQSHQHCSVLHRPDGIQVGPGASSCTTVSCTPAGCAGVGSGAVQASSDMPTIKAKADLITFIELVLSKVVSNNIYSALDSSAGG